MFPFISLGSRIVLDSWEVMVALGIFAAALVAILALRGETGGTRACMLALAMAVGAVLGAHLSHWLLHPGPIRWDPAGLLLFWRDGHSLIGAPIFCGLLLLLISRIVPSVPFWPTADAFSLGAPLGLFFARIGCYLKGCCWGIPIREGHPFFGLSVKLVRNTMISLHPVQLYSAAAALAVFFILLAVRPRQKTPGILTALLVLLYAPARFFLEFYRGDTKAAPFLGPLAVHQGICLLLVPAGILLLYRRVRGPGRTKR
jgi:phosphatidylglycerol:prolipoprotein diacylglycerol transferase